ncbi:tRNA 2-thiouridine(34) synthase MnmA, partial [Candidatus Uhrbacteria bacterium]|nr:tRNA 2-thiouridine(34) synthase MnmA [Candidatus Uhrbacteria bacterium]
MDQKKTKVVVALSGGVDSSVAAALLLERGYEVTAAFMKNWSNTKTVRGECLWQEEYRDACRVAATLDVPIVLFDFEKEYREQVVEYLFREYGAGRTPNPDVRCNSEVKFPLFWREAQKLGADLIATGHHVRRWQMVNGRWQMVAGVDKNKDQSYFLHGLTQADLTHTLFPIGEYTKAEVRAMARERGLPTADKRSTRGICFVGKVAMPEFLAQAVPTLAGPVRTTRGEVIGTHGGIAPYTIGQRHGFGGGGGTPYYVVAKEPETNTLIVGDAHDPALYREEIEVRDMHWISSEAPKLPLECHARIRYRAPLVPITLKAESC